MSFRLQGFQPPEEEEALPPPFLPCRFALHSGRTHDFEGLDPTGSPSSSKPPLAYPLDVSPSEAHTHRRGPGFPAPPLACLTRGEENLLTGKPADSHPSPPVDTTEYQQTADPDRSRNDYESQNSTDPASLRFASPSCQTPEGIRQFGATSY
jgi:hypothetical protein